VTEMRVVNASLIVMLVWALKGTTVRLAALSRSLSNILTVIRGSSHVATRVRQLGAAPCFEFEPLVCPKRIEEIRIGLETNGWFGKFGLSLGLRGALLDGKSR
jgi:hypothetical protein